MIKIKLISPKLFFERIQENKQTRKEEIEEYRQKEQEEREKRS